MSASVMREPGRGAFSNAAGPWVAQLLILKRCAIEQGAGIGFRLAIEEWGLTLDMICDAIPGLAEPARSAQCAR